MKPPAFTIKKHEDHFDLAAQNGDTMVCGFETVSQAADMVAKIMGESIRANVDKGMNLTELLAKIPAKGSTS